MKIVAATCLALSAASSVTLDKWGKTVGQVHEHIADSNCKENYITKSKEACIRDGQCFPYGTDAENKCSNIKLWQWQHAESEDPYRRSYAPGVLPSPTHRVTANGGAAEKVIWAYTGDIFEGEAQEIYNPEGQPTVDNVLNTPVNHLTFIANVNVEKPTEWFVPGQNNTDGCGQRQTNRLPFGYDVNKTDQSEFHANLKKMHNAGITITLTLASWCTQLPVLTSEEWTETMFGEFVTYYETLRETVFGGTLDGVDFDWEGFCKETCLKGHDDCSCGWDDKVCGEATPEALAQGLRYTTPTGKNMMCWILPTKSTIQVMTGITAAMKAAGHVVTLVPMSTSFYSGDDDTTPNQVMRNEYVKYRMNNGKNLLELADGVLLQWYSGFDAALCVHSKDPNACTCDNIPDDSYPNIIRVNDSVGTLISSYYDTPTGGGNMFPTSFPVRCMACGKPNTPACSPPDEDWFVPKVTDVNGTAVEPPEVIAEHNQKFLAYSQAHDNGVPYWWVKGVSVDARCPRGIDCPDWRYEGEKPYSRQLKLLQSISKVIDLNKVSIGFETLGIDIQVQMKSYADKALPFTDVAPDSKWTGGPFWKQCNKNLTKADVEAGALNQGMIARCAQPLASQQWGLQLNATEMYAMNLAVKEATGKELAGIGVYTLAGMLAVDPSKPESDMFAGKCRFWYPAARDLAKMWNIPTKCGSNCWNMEERCGKPAAPTPSPGPGPSPPGPSPPAPTPSSGSKWGCDRWQTPPVCRQAATGFDTLSDCQMTCTGSGPAPGPGPAPAPGGQCTGCFPGSSGSCKNLQNNDCFDKINGQCPGGTTPC
jgi:hypothetical protein